MNKDLQKISAILSSQVYSADWRDLPIIDEGMSYKGFVRVAVADKGNGLYAEAWRNAKTKEVIIAFRGTDFTETWKKDFTYANVPLGMGLNNSSPQWTDAQAFVDQVLKDYKGNTVSFTGHSLGGGLASLASVKYGLPAYVFAPAPFKASSDSFKFIPDGMDAKMVKTLNAGIAEFDKHFKYEPSSLVEGAIWGLLAASVSVTLIPVAYKKLVAEYEFAAKQRDKVPGYLEAENYRQKFIEARLEGKGDLISTFTVDGEILSEIIKDPELARKISSEYGLTLYEIAKSIIATFPSDPGEFVKISNETPSDDQALAVALAKHNMVLHVLVLHTDFERVLQGNEAMLDALLTSGIGPVSHSTKDAKSEVDISIVYRALFMSSSFYKEFLEAFKSTGNETKIGDLFKEGVAEIVLQKASLFIDSTAATGKIPFKPFEDTGDKNTIVIDMKDIDQRGTKDAFGHAIGRSDIDKQIEKLLATELTDQGLSTKAAASLAKSYLLNGMPEDGPLNLSWTKLVVHSGSTGMEYEGENYASVVIGGGQDDRIIGSSKWDFLIGNAGDDTIEGGRGADIISGGANGSIGDTASYEHSKPGVTIKLGSSKPQIGGDAQGDVLVGIENVIGSGSKDIIQGDSGQNVLVGNGGDDALIGGLGNDRLYGGDGKDYLVGGIGNDILDGGPDREADLVVAGSGNDLIYVGKNDEVYGGTGNDAFVVSDVTGIVRNYVDATKIEGGAGHDIIYVSFDEFWGQKNYNHLLGRINSLFTGVEEIRVGWTQSSSDPFKWTQNTTSATINLSKLHTAYQYSSAGDAQKGFDKFLKGFVPQWESFGAGSDLGKVEKAGLTAGAGTSAIVVGTLDVELGKAIDGWYHQTTDRLLKHYVSNVEQFNGTGLSNLSGTIRGDKVTVYGAVGSDTKMNIAQIFVTVSFVTTTGTYLEHLALNVPIIKPDSSVKPKIIAEDDISMEDGKEWNPNLLSFELQDVTDPVSYTVTGDYSGKFTVNKSGQLVYDKPVFNFGTKDTVNLTITANTDKETFTKDVEIHRTSTGTKVKEVAPVITKLTTSSGIDPVVGEVIATVKATDANEAAAGLRYAVEILNTKPSATPLLGYSDGKIVLLRVPTQAEVGSELRAVVRVVDSTQRYVEKEFTFTIKQSVINGDYLDNILYGASLKDAINGGEGDDAMIGGGGDDVLKGGAGADTAIYRGSKADYTLVKNADGTVSVKDNRSGSPEGKDLLHSVETAEFADGSVDLRKLKVDLPPKSVSLSGKSVKEKVSAGTVVGKLSAVDPEDKALTYKLINDAGGLFKLSGKNLVTAKGIDYEALATKSLKITVEVFDGAHRVQKTFGIEVLDVNEAPKSVKLSKAAVTENTKIGTTVGVFSALDPEGKAVNYKLTDDAGGLFKLSGTKLQVAKGVDFEKVQSDTITVDVKDATGLSVRKTFTITVSDALETINGTSKSEKISGGIGADKIVGGGGNDALIGLAGNDVLHGDAGNDKIIGGSGFDDLYGGSGRDTFVFSAISDLGKSKAATDTIFDFSQGQKDIIDLSGIDANGKLAGDAAFSLLGTAAFTKQAGQVRYEKTASDTYVYGDVNGDGKVDFILHLGNAISLTKADFLL